MINSKFTTRVVQTEGGGAAGVEPATYSMKDSCIFMNHNLCKVHMHGTLKNGYELGFFKEFVIR